jgi:hypothetical protein
MSPELDAKLRVAYPLVFAVKPPLESEDADGPVLPSPFAIRGFECGDGWCDLLDALCMNLQHATKNGSPQVIASQVKEKFGALRFYTCGHDVYQDGMIVLAETMSARICEVCGNRGRTIRGGWIKTRCAEHEEV